MFAKPAKLKKIHTNFFHDYTSFAYSPETKILKKGKKTFCRKFQKHFSHKPAVTSRSNKKFCFEGIQSKLYTLAGCAKHSDSLEILGFIEENLNFVRKKEHNQILLKYFFDPCLKSVIELFQNCFQKYQPKKHSPVNSKISPCNQSSIHSTPLLIFLHLDVKQETQMLLLFLFINFYRFFQQNRTFSYFKMLIKSFYDKIRLCVLMVG